MKLNFLVASALALGSVSAFAAAALTDKDQANIQAAIDEEVTSMERALNATEEDSSLGHDKICAEVKLTDEQKATLHNAGFEFKKSMVTLKGNVKIAGMTYEHTLSSGATARADGDAAAAAVNDSIAKLVAAKTAFGSSVFYDILTAEQRAPAMACLKAMKQHRHGKHGHKHGKRP